MAEARIGADGSEPFACESCDCTVWLEPKLAEHGEPFLETLEAGT